jgi:hypothetical protein
MKTRIWLFAAVILLICVLLALFRSAKHEQPISHETALAVTNQPIQPKPPQSTENRQASNTPQMAPLPPTATPLAQALAATNPVAAMRLALWQAPIEFYGKVVDEDSNAIAGAKVNFHWVEIPAEDGNRSTNIESDAEGLFSLRDQRGPDLMVSVGKEGYYTSRSTPDGFHYAFGNEILHPDAANPIVFHLRKKGQGTELITSENGFRLKVDVRVPRDNTPVRADLMQQKASATGQLEISQIKPPWQEATNWSFRMSIPDGGLVENQDEFQFEAPETGYQPTVEYNFTKGETNWTTQVTKQFYITFGQPRKYGWLRIESNLAQETIFLTYAINPTGSQNLEPQ